MKHITKIITTVTTGILLVGCNQEPAPKPIIGSIGEKKIGIELLSTSEVKLTGKKTGEIFTDIISIGKRIYTSDYQGNVYGFITSKNLKLNLDKNFGINGVLKFDSRIERLIKLPKGDIVAVPRVGHSKLIRAGKITADINLLEDDIISASGEWGVRYHTGGSSAKGYSKIERLTLKKGMYERTEWIERSDKIANYTMRNISTATIGNNKIFIGGLVKAGHQELTCIDNDKQVKFTIGNPKSFTPDSFGYFHDIEITPAGIVVVDSNFRKLKLISHEGKFLGEVSLAPLFGLNYPWIPAASYNVNDGYLYILAADKKDIKGKKVVEGFIYRISGLNIK